MNRELQAKNRTRLLAIITVGIMAVFIVRLFYLQIVQHDYYLTLARDEQFRQRVLPAQRGEIYVLDAGIPVKLVYNQKVYTVFADPKIIEDREKVVNTLRRIVGGNMRPKVEELVGNTQSRYQIVATKVSRKQAELLKAERLVGIGFQQESQRVYPEGQLAAQTLGYVNTDGEGQYGVEGYFNSRLTGKDGLLSSITDVRDVPLTIGAKNVNIPAKDGEDIVLTLDRNIQAYAEKALAKGMKDSGATHGSVIIMDPMNGHVLSMANLPTYDPANYHKVTDASVFNNATISIPYEPGSDIKTLTVATGLDKGAIRPDSTYNNTDYITVADRTITNATKGQLGDITMQHALNYSLNTGMVTIAKRLGNGEQITYQARETIYQYFHDKFRLGQRTGIELSGESEGIVIPPTDPDGGAVRYSNMSFGQGMDVTMVQVSAAFSALVNGGTYFNPTVFAGTIDSAGTFVAATPKPNTPHVISESAASEVRDMIHKARTAFYARTDRIGFEVGGKTGTSQTIENGVYVDNQTVGTYLGYGGNETPRYVIMVQVSGRNLNLQGGTHAMPIFNDISNWLIDYFKLQPKD